MQRQVLIQYEWYCVLHNMHQSLCISCSCPLCKYISYGECIRMQQSLVHNAGKHAQLLCLTVQSNQHLAVSCWQDLTHHTLPPLAQTQLPMTPLVLHCKSVKTQTRFPSDAVLSWLPMLPG